MKLGRDTIGEIIFWAAVVFGCALYFVSAPSGLPWSGSTRMALAYSGTIAELPAMPHPVWGYFVQVFGGHFVALSAVAAAIAGGLVGALANRYFGWRIGAAAALTWLVLPPVWNRAVIGTHGMFWAFGIVLAVWVANAVFLLVTRRARKTAEEQGAANTKAAMQDSVSVSWHGRINRIAAWALLGAAVLFVLVSVSRHDYTIGEAASAYARLMLDEIGGKTAILGGVADDQMIWEAERREAGSGVRLVALRNDEAYRTQFVARVRREWPGETNLWVAAQVGPSAFADVAVRKCPDRVYVMTGASTTLEKWTARWEAMKPYCDSDDDPFIPTMRRAFAFEANTLGNRLQEDVKLKEAWELYWRTVEEVDRRNVSAWVNLSEMMRRGYATDAQRRKRIEDAMAELHKGLAKGRAAERAAAIVAMCGPVMQDSKVLAEYRAAIEKRMKELEKEPREKRELSPELKTIAEWNNEMLAAHDSGDIAKAAHIARTILSKPKWQGFLPANAVMGTAMAAEGDYVASAAFYHTAVTGKAKPPPSICNDYADTLRHLGRFEEAEKYARRAVAESDERGWLFCLTLAEVLRDAGKNPNEVKALVDGVLKRAPVKIKGKIRKEFGR